jgi:hypothetical protein
MLLASAIALATLALSISMQLSRSGAEEVSQKFFNR